MAKHRAEVLYVHLPSTKDASYLETLDVLVGAARLEDVPVALVIDYHVQSPYHGPPPHLHSNTTDGYGYAPFSWVDGWNWARKQIGMLMLRYDPDYIQQGERNAFRDGWVFGAEKPHWGYNDTMTIFEQAAGDAEWHGTFVVEGWKVCMKKAREKFGASIWHTDLEDIEVDTTVEPPPPPEDCAGCMEELEQADKVIDSMEIENDNLSTYAQQLEADLAMVEAANAQYATKNRALVEALDECVDECGDECEECEDCDEKYQGLEDSLADLLDILWSFVGGRR